ncbi:MAG: putative quinol monooxygenase [Bacillota bacterium]|nr:putative quinol monooxygenase [Bacillota bacterium]
MFKVLAKTKTLPGKSEDFKEKITALAPKTRSYPGCVSYQVLQSSEDENVFWMVEEWDNEVAFAEHFNAPFTKEFEKQIDGVVDGDVEPYICNFVVQL